MYCRSRRGRFKYELKGCFSLGETIVAPYSDPRGISIWHPHHGNHKFHSFECSRNLGVYQHAFELVRLDSKKKRYILVFRNSLSMEEWKKDITGLTEKQAFKQKQESDRKASKHQEVRKLKPFYRSLGD